MAESDLSNNAPDWQQSVIEKLLFETLKEQRRARRWRGVWRVILIILFVIFLINIMPDSSDWMNKAESHTAIVDLKGEISATSAASAKDVIKGLHKAFEDDNTKGVILRINSPGGSAVQSGIIYDEILRLRKRYPKTPIYAVVEDSCASGAYYVASATNKIFANRASFVGSIGALIDSFGYTELMQKVGVQRRLITAGKYKGFLDEFSPLDATEAAFAKSLVEEVRQQFITAIKAARGDKIKDNGNVFTGLVWTGEQALGFGLVDALSDTQTVARDVIGAPKTVDYTAERGFFNKINAEFSTAIIDKFFARNAMSAQLRQ